MARIVHNGLTTVLFIISTIFWYQFYSFSYQLTGAWYFVILIFTLMSPFILLNLNFLKLSEEKGAMFAIMNIDRVIGLTILEIKRNFSEDDEVRLAEKRREEMDLKFLIGEDE